MASQSYAAQLKADTDQEQPLNVTPDYYTDVNPPPFLKMTGFLPLTGAVSETSLTRVNVCCGAAEQRSAAE